MVILKSLGAVFGFLPKSEASEVRIDFFPSVFAFLEVSRHGQNETIDTSRRNFLSRKISSILYIQCTVNVYAYQWFHL